MVLVASAAAEARAEAPDGGIAADATVDAPVGADAGAGADVDRSAPPVPLARIAPTYPPDAERAGVAGDVILLLTVDPEGTVTDVAVEAGLPAGLTEAAVGAARAARFRPALDRTGHPMAVRLRWTVHFTLPERRSRVASPAPAPPRPPPPAAPPAQPN